MGIVSNEHMSMKSFKENIKYELDKYIPDIEINELLYLNAYQVILDLGKPQSMYIGVDGRISTIVLNYIKKKWFFFVRYEINVEVTDRYLNLKIKVGRKYLLEKNKMSYSEFMSYLNIFLTIF